MISRQPAARTQARRLPEKQSDDLAALHDLLDHALVGHVVVVDDALVLARNQFESSTHYRSAMALGRCGVLGGQAKARALAPPTEDRDRPVWAGAVPVHHTFGTSDDASDLVAPQPIPLYIAPWPLGRA